MPGEPSQLRRALGWAGTALAALLVLFALLSPHDADEFTASAFARLPVEGLLGVLVLLVLPGRWRRITGLAAGALLGLVTVVKLLDLGFDAVLFRPFDLVLDWPLLGPAVDFVRTTMGRPVAILVQALAIALVAGLVALCALAVRHLAVLLARRRAAVIRVVAALAVLWLLGAVPASTGGVTAFLAQHAVQVRKGLADREEFARQTAVDPFRATPGGELLGALRGKDVLVVFVESYGRDALDNPALAPAITPLLDNGSRELAELGYRSRSGFLTSPTAGGGSWLAQATLLSGLWIDNQQRYQTLVASDRRTLTSAFHDAGWRSIGVVPGITRAWPEGEFFGYDRIYAAADLGYRGPRFGFATAPDQFTLSTFQRAERTPGDRTPVMAAIPLVTSHVPWTPTPALLPWDGLGDGSVYDSMPSGGGPPAGLLGRSQEQVRADYRTSLSYTLSTLVSYVRTHGDDDLVLLFLGDHQPNQAVTGTGASRDVPVTVVSKVPVVEARSAEWGWTEGLRPGAGAPVWPMHTFRDRFLAAFGR
ncbi:hypothetical protein JOF53_007595 [Crossiella equi]|uniref:Sulfatase n=1 Tax=Crossiella equi TaxID=130796 RepID=A0ABS5AQ76_9PSEU|nr:sulfatase [Crossiella equi]MBP2478723.1 hypothetical protein [Crossiella equi]